ncbi:MAG: type IV toxin-antitoxin system AbiEi family antitoxin [Thermoleophilaceae bacterium]
MAAVLRGGDDAVLSHRSAAALWAIASEPAGVIEISVPLSRRVRERGIVAHRRTALNEFELTTRDGIPVTMPAATLIDLAAQLGDGALEAAINEADHRDLLDPAALVAAVERATARPGVGRLATFSQTGTSASRRRSSSVVSFDWSGNSSSPSRRPRFG